MKRFKNFPITSKRRDLTLLEVLIAFSIVVLCIFPLLYPHVAIFRQQSSFIEKIEMDHAVNLLFGKVYEKLYMQEIPIQDILEHKTFPITNELLKEAGYTKKPTFTGTYQFTEKKKEKSNETKSETAYLLTLLFSLTSNQNIKEEPYHFTYKIFLVNQSGENQMESSNDSSQ